MRGREYRRDGVPEYVVDGDNWPAKGVDGDDAWALYAARLKCPALAQLN